MNKYRPLWKRLLDEDTISSLGLSRGISIPFLIGAYYQKGLISDDDLQNSTCIEKVLDRIANSIGKNWLLVERCGDYDESRDYNDQVESYQIIMVLQYPQGDDKISKRPHYRSKIFFPKEWKDSGDLILKLWEFYGRCIQNRTFSWRQDCWHPFQDNVRSNSGKIINELLTINNL